MNKLKGTITEFPSHSIDWKKFELNNKSTALNILYVPHNIKKIRHAYKSKHNLKRKNQVILLMISDDKKLHYLAVKSLTALLKGVISNHVGDFYCLNCFHAYTTKNRLEKHKSVCENHDYCYVEMPEEGNKILKYSHGDKSMMQPFAIYFDFESLLEKVDNCCNDLEKSSATKINEHAPSSYSLFTCCLFDAKGHKLDSYRGEDCLKKFCKNLKEHVLKIINYEKKKIMPLTEEEREAHRCAKICYICRKEFSTNDNDDKKNYKARDHCHYTGKYRGAAHSICNLRYNTSKEISVIAHNASTYNYHLIIKELAKKFKGSFECLGENTEKYITT